MIIWVNGCFGVGKSTIAGELNKQIKESIIYDPEEIGGFLSNTLPIKKDDFQDYELWRIINYETLKYLNSRFKIIIVPMTITNLQYYDEIIGKLKKEEICIKHFILSASKENIIKRLDSRGNSTKWTYDQVDRCIRAFDSFDYEGEKITTDNMSVDEITKIIMKMLDL